MEGTSTISVTSSSKTEPITIAVVGLEFGAEFAEIYSAHPDVGDVVICDRDESLIGRVMERLGGVKASTSLDDVLRRPDVDAVHVVTGLTDHADHTIRALQAGKHVACAVPMALSIDDIRAIQLAQQRAGLVYMMMETAVYTRECLWVLDRITEGWFGEITFGQGAHHQDMTNWPGYWVGLPPTYYMTHAIAPLLAALNTHVTSVRALGSGRYDASAPEPYGPTFPVESALFELADHPAALEVTRSLGKYARSYTEAFSLYGSSRSFEWPQLENEQEPLAYEFREGDWPRGRPVAASRIEAGTQTRGLPAQLLPYLNPHEATGADGKVYVRGGGHGGSHPHLVHEFVSAIRDGRSAYIDQVRAAQWTAPGILAHESALNGGCVVEVPSFTQQPAV